MGPLQSAPVLLSRNSEQGFRNSATSRQWDPSVNFDSMAFSYAKSLCLCQWPVGKDSFSVTGHINLSVPGCFSVGHTSTSLYPQCLGHTHLWKPPWQKVLAWSRSLTISAFPVSPSTQAEDTKMQEIMRLAHEFLQNFCAGNQQNQALLHKHINLFLNPGVSQKPLDNPVLGGLWGNQLSLDIVGSGTCQNVAFIPKESTVASSQDISTPYCEPRMLWV